MLGNVYVQKWCYIWYCVSLQKTTPSFSCTIIENQKSIHIVTYKSQDNQFDNIPIVDGEIDFYIENVGCVLI